MGVKRHFILNTGSKITLGPAIFYALMENYDHLLREGYFEVPLSKLKIPEGGWRKRVIYLFKIMNKRVGSSAGSLRELKTHNPKGDPEYRQALTWVISHSPKPKTPRLRFFV